MSTSSSEEQSVFHSTSMPCGSGMCKKNSTIWVVYSGIRLCREWMSIGSRKAKGCAEKRLKIWDFADGRPLIISSGQKIERTI